MKLILKADYSYLISLVILQFIFLPPSAPNPLFAYFHGLVSLPSLHDKSCTFAFDASRQK